MKDNKMNFFKKYTTPFGYVADGNPVDAYGVNHSGFSTRDELEYQFARLNREKQLADILKQHGIPQQDYPQLGTGFWQNHPQNNDNVKGFEIAANVENMKNITDNNHNCYMTFDGQNLNLFVNKQKVNNLDAMSGQPDYQAKKFQNILDKGPIPEGIYYADQDQRQSIGFVDAVIGAATGILNVKRGKWKGSLPAWGRRRIWLRPDSSTNTYGRDGFTIHGGWSKGSAGCIDIPWQTGKLSDYMDNCQDSVPVYVNYPKDNW